MSDLSHTEFVAAVAAQLPQPAPSTPTAAPEPPPRRSVFRVNYYVRGQVRTAFVCAYTGGEAAAFMGVEDGSATASSVAYPVEIAGLDPQHDALPILPVTKAEPGASAFLSEDELAKLRKLISAL